MGWIVGVRNTGAAPRLVEWSSDGTREVSAVEASLLVDAKSRKYSRYVECDLADLKRLDVDEAREIAALAGIHEDVARAQSFWVLAVGSRKLFVPAQVLIQALVGMYRLQREAMFSPVGYQLKTVLVEERDGLRAKLSSSRTTRTLDDTPELAVSILWTSCYPSARKMHASVLRYALNGRFDIELPRARLTMSFVGQELGHCSVLATRLSIAAIVPLEAPMDHAAGKVPAKFVIRDVDQISPARRKSSWDKSARRGPQDGGYDADIRDARFRTPLSDEEWHSVRHVLFKHASRMRLHEARARGKVDLILLKRSTGDSWQSVASSSITKTTLESYFSHLVLTGKWELLRAHVVKARGGRAATRRSRTSRSGKDDAAPTAEQLRALRIQRLSMTKKAFACALGVSATTVSAWENGEKPPKPNMLAMLRVLEARGLDGLEEVQKMRTGRKPRTVID